MSIKAMTRVWEHSKEKGSNLLALLALADHADDNGECWPSEDRIAKKIRMSVRQTQRLLVALEAKGEIIRRLGNGRGNATHYLILAGLTDKQKDDKITSFIPIKDDNLTPLQNEERVTNLSIKGDKSDTKRVTNRKPQNRVITKTGTAQTHKLAGGEPSLEPSLEPSSIPQSAKASAVSKSSPKPTPYPLWQAWIDAITPDGKTPPGITFNAFSKRFKELMISGVTPECISKAGDLVTAWRMALPLHTMSVIKWEVDSMTVLVRRALSLLSDDLTPDDVSAFVKARYAEKDRSGKRFWAGKLVTFEHVVDNIAAWKCQAKAEEDNPWKVIDNPDPATWLDPADMVEYIPPKPKVAGAA